MKPATHRPRLEEVLAALETMRREEVSHSRASERIEITIAAEMIMKDGNVVPVRLRDLSHSGFGCFHYGTVELGEVRLKLAVNSYRVMLKWCVRCEGDLYMSGGPILSMETASTSAV